MVGGSYSSAEVQSVYFTAPVDWPTGHTLEKSYPSGEMQSVYCTAPTDWATGHSLGESYPSGEMQSVYPTAPADWTTGNCWGVLPLCRDAVGVFYSPIQLDHITLVGRCSWCKGYRRRKCTRRHEFKSWTRLVAFHIALIPLGKV